MKQIIFIRGGEAFDKPEDYHAYLQNRSFDPFDSKKSWRDRVARALSEEYEMMIPLMPCKQNADYLGRKIRFERHFSYLNNEELILIGHSLGASFLVKRLSENNFPKHISQLHLVCTMISSEWLVGEGLGQFVADRNKITSIETQVEKIFLYHSKDDPVVPYWHSEKLAELLPKSTFLTFQNRKHFNQPALPELLENINYYK